MQSSHAYEIVNVRLSEGEHHVFLLLPSSIMTPAALFTNDNFLTSFSISQIFLTNGSTVCTNIFRMRACAHVSCTTTIKSYLIIFTRFTNSNKLFSLLYCSQLLVIFSLLKKKKILHIQIKAFSPLRNLNFMLTFMHHIKTHNI